MGTTPWSGEDTVMDDPNSPAVDLSWNEAQAFVTAVNNLTDETFRLPTEAEWEYACRAGTTTEFYFGDSMKDLSDYAWWDENTDSVGEETAQVVGKLLPNRFGLFDMHGNVAEWCEDWYGEYSSSVNTDPTGPSSGTRRIVRGGSWWNNDAQLQSAARDRYDPTNIRASRIGFRLAK